ncbi:LysM peptidoglycan-binding domain-containing protein [Nibricoccus sp. IMCC34717]|uniref:LysM peptidoglycan-binding domain-containing protein n=1 Tax=Nibricoccus sp. IMCC34717 TaxID=3034021 RepID=UPI00384FDD95
MNILRIFGIVVAVHLTAFLFVFAIPGCRSTTHRSSNKQPRVESKENVIRFPGSPSRPPPVADTNPVAAAPANSGSLVVPVADAAPSGGSTIVFPGMRQNPVRPDSPEAQSITNPPAPEPKTYTVSTKDSLWSIAKKFSVTEKDLAAANKLRSGAPLRVGQVLVIPVPAGMGPGESVAAPTPTFVYKVHAGESLALIAKRAGISTAELKSMNNLQSDIVRVGQELTLPAAMSAPKPETAKAPKPGMIRHTVKPGESLGGIARKYGVALRDVATANHIANPAALRVGTELLIPSKSGGTAGVAPTPTASPEAKAPATATATTPASTAASPTATATPAAPTPVPKFEIPLVGPSPTEASPISPATEAPPVNPVDDGLVTPTKE